MILGRANSTGRSEVRGLAPNAPSGVSSLDWAVAAATALLLAVGFEHSFSIVAISLAVRAFERPRERFDDPV